jgi:hypothetical protein
MTINSLSFRCAPQKHRGTGERHGQTFGLEKRPYMDGVGHELPEHLLCQVQGAQGVERQTAQDTEETDGRDLWKGAIR